MLIFANMNPRNTEDPQLEALVSLLDEPDFPTFAKVRESIFAYGLAAVPVLEEAWEKTFDNAVQHRIEDIIHNIQYDQLFLDIAQWSHYRSQNLEEAYLLFTRFQYQGLDQALIKSRIGKIRRDLWLELNDNLTALEKVKVLNHIFFDINGFQIPSRQVPEPAFLFLNTMLDTRTAYPFALGLLYTILAQSLDLPVQAVILPGERLVMAWLDQYSSDPTTEARVMFYINPENHGSVFTRNEITALLKKLKIEPDEKYYRPVTNKFILHKLFELLAYLYTTNGEAGRADEINHLRSAI